jgi:hypothetical protein
MLVLLGKSEMRLPMRQGFFTLKVERSKKNAGDLSKYNSEKGVHTAFFDAVREITKVVNAKSYELMGGAKNEPISVAGNAKAIAGPSETSKGD